MATRRVSTGHSRWIQALSRFLHSGGARTPEWRALPPYAPALIVFCCGSVYGAVMGGYNGLSDERAWMVLFGALKVPLLFVATMLIAVPCFYVLNLLVGVGDDFGAVWRALVDYQVLVAIQLAALAPVTLLVNVTNNDYRTALAWSTLLFAATGWNARRALLACYTPLVAANRVHLTLRRFWFVLYAFVGIQMGWDLRPFVGSPDMPVQFFREHIGNAYVETSRLFINFAGDLLRVR